MSKFRDWWDNFTLPEAELRLKKTLQQDYPMYYNEKEPICTIANNLLKR